MPSGNTASNHARPRYLYLLLNDHGVPFWVGITSRPDGRLADHRATFTAVSNLRMLVLGKHDNYWLANQAERATTHALTLARVGLANFNYVVDKTSQASRERHKAIWKRYAGGRPEDGVA